MKSVDVRLLSILQKVVQNRLFVPENIEDVRKLIVQDRHATYHEIDATIGINITI